MTRLLIFLFLFAFSRIGLAVDKPYKIVDDLALVESLHNLLQQKLEEIKIEDVRGVLGNDADAFLVPFLYLDGKFPRERLQKELKEAKELLESVDASAPVLLILLLDKKDLSNADLVLASRMSRQLRIDIAKAFLGGN